MNIWLTYCRKTIPSCTYCHESIELDELMVCGQMWQKSEQEGGEQRRWLTNFRWHGKRNKDNQCCWLESQIARLSQSPVVETRGRKALQLPEEIRLVRLKILRDRARAVARLKELILAPLDQKDTDEIIRIGSRIEELKEKIQNYGGVPASWV